MANDKKDDVDINKIYGHLCKMPKEEFCTKFKIKEGGLSDEEITFRRQKYGLNEVTQTKPGIITCFVVYLHLLIIYYWQYLVYYITQMFI